MNPFDNFMLQALRKLNHELGAVVSVILSSEIDKPERTVRHYLRRLELAGMVNRPYGKRKGWMVIEDNVQLRSIQAGV